MLLPLIRTASVMTCICIYAYYICFLGGGGTENSKQIFEKLLEVMCYNSNNCLGSGCFEAVQGPVVQSIVSSLRGQLVKCFTTL